MQASFLGTTRQRIAALNAPLLGAPSGRVRLDTPALILDLDIFERNIATMAGLARDRGVSLRPHGKTHKCSEIAQRQVAAGAIGICCAKLSEAEALSGKGIDSILLTAPIVDPAKLDRLVDILRRMKELIVVVDDAEVARALSAKVSSSGCTLKVLIDIDVGWHRTGVTSVEQALDMGRLVSTLPGLKLAGIQGYAGHLQHISEYGERRRQANSVLAMLAEVRSAFRDSSLCCDIVTGSGTGTCEIDAEQNVFTELQVGSYVFMDVQYQHVAPAPGTAYCFERSLFIATQVISNRQKGFVTTDAGSKSFVLDGPPPVIARGAPEGSTYAPFGDQFGRVTLPEGAVSLPLGTRLELITSHCDPTVNLYEVFHCVRGDVIEALWAIDGGATS